MLATIVANTIAQLKLLLTTINVIYKINYFKENSSSLNEYSVSIFFL